MYQSKPINSRVHLETTVGSPSVQRNHPSHYVQQCEGKIYGHPENDNPPKVVGNYRFWQAQIYQAHLQGITPNEVLMGDLEPLQNLYSKMQGQEWVFRGDLPLQPSNHVILLDEFKITDPIYDHESFKLQCLEEIVRVFCFIEIVAVAYKKVSIKLNTLKKAGFARVSETDFCVRDNFMHFNQPMPVEVEGLHPQVQALLRMMFG